MHVRGVVNMNCFMKSFIKWWICETKVQAFGKIAVQYEKYFIFRITWNKVPPEEGVLKQAFALISAECHWSRERTLWHSCWEPGMKAVYRWCSKGYLLPDVRDKKRIRVLREKILILREWLIVSLFWNMNHTYWLEEFASCLQSTHKKW